MRGCHLHARVNELAWPERIVLVGELGLELNCTGKLVYLIVRRDERASIKLVRTVAGQSNDVYRAVFQRLGYLRQLLLRHGEHRRNWMVLHDRDDALRVGAVHQVAGIHQTEVPPAQEWAR